MPLSILIFYIEVTMKMVRLQDSTNRKVERLQNRLNKEDPLIKLNRGKVIDIAVSEKLVEK